MTRQPQPVLTNGAAAVVLAFAAPLLAKWGIDQEGAAEVVSLAASAVGSVVAIWRLFRARAEVTPVSSPNLPGAAVVPDVLVEQLRADVQTMLAMYDALVPEEERGPWRDRLEIWATGP